MPFAPAKRWVGRNEWKEPPTERISSSVSTRSLGAGEMVVQESVGGVTERRGLSGRTAALEVAVVNDSGLNWEEMS